MARIQTARSLVAGIAVILAVLPTGGCDSKGDEKKAPGQKEGGKHEHKAPHGGTLVEFGEEFAHLELQLDPASGRMTGYVLDGEAEKPVRVAQSEVVISVKGTTAAFSVPLNAVGNALTGEKPGDTSQFEGQSDRLKGLKEFDAAVLKVNVKGKDFSNVTFNFPKGNEDK